MSRRTAAAVALPSITEPKPGAVSTASNNHPETVADWVESSEPAKTRKPTSEPASLAEPPLAYDSLPAKLVQLALPFGNPPSPNESRRVGMLYVKDLTTHQRYGLLCLRNGLSRAGATLKNGTPVDRPSHVIRYILEQAIDGAASS